MKKLTYVFAIVAAASTAAVAKDLKQDEKAAAPAVSATQMTEAEIDKVTASGVPSSPGLGNLTAYEAGGTAEFPGQNNNHASPQGFTVYPGSGISTVIH
jgi:hypothetical protein